MGIEWGMKNAVIYIGFPFGTMEEFGRNTRALCGNG